MRPKSASTARSSWCCARAQAEAALEGTAAVTALRRVRVYSPTRANRERFARTMSERIGVEVVPVSAPQQAFEDPDIVPAATSAYRPVFERAWLRPGASSAGIPRSSSAIC